MEQVEQSQTNFISEIDELLSTYNHIHSDALAKQLIPLIKKAFGTIFLMDYHHTFEELVDSIERFDTCCMNIRSSIDTLHKQEVELIAQKNARNTEAVDEIKAIQTQINISKKRYASCRRISELLENDKVRGTVSSFCKQLSELQYSGMKMTRDECTKLLFHFLWIVNHFTFDFEDKPAENTFTKIFKGKKKSYDSHTIEDMMKEISIHLDKHEIDDATHAYSELLKKYKDMSKDEQASYYGDIFILWFEMHFYEHRSVD